MIVHRQTERTLLALACILFAVAFLVAPAAAWAQMPTDPSEALRVFEEDIRDWDDGPVQYLLTNEEHEIWKELDNDEQRRDFIQWFWDRRDDDLRDRQHPFKEGFYTRVAVANKRFPGFPRGWKSDRGRVWITLGQPDGITAGGLTNSVWRYDTYGGILKTSSYLGEMQVGFLQVDTSRWEIAGGIGPGAWPIYLVRAFDIVNLAVIENPDLEWKQ